MMERSFFPPIITSLLDNDWYKFTMGQVIWRFHRDAIVTFAFTNRTRDVHLPEFIRQEDLERELAAARNLRFTDEDIAYLRSRGISDEGYLAALRDLELPPITVRNLGDRYDIRSTGPWYAVSMWEIVVLGIVNELYYREVLHRQAAQECIPFLAAYARAVEEGVQRLDAKIVTFAANPDIILSEQGRRRRWSRTWQECVVARLAASTLGARWQFVGTSNVALARQFGLTPIGTMAHEMYMVYAALGKGDDAALLASHNRMLRDWEAVHGDRVSVALTDTFGSEFFFRDFTAEQAAAWKALRHDSGDPFAFVDRAIAFYRAKGVDPMTKTIAFSDGLDPQMVLRLADYCRGRIKCTFGIGTNLSNDLGFRTLSLVMKAVEVDGWPTVKLSDNPEKATGPADEVARYQRVFGHVEGARVPLHS
jgi:nicotinate phosphoribosyltransferase